EDHLPARPAERDGARDRSCYVRRGPGDPDGSRPVVPGSRPAAAEREPRQHAARRAVDHGVGVAPVVVAAARTPDRQYRAGRELPGGLATGADGPEPALLSAPRTGAARPA